MENKILKAEVEVYLKPLKEKDPARYKELMDGVREVTETQSMTIEAKRSRNPLLLGQKIERLRYLFTGSEQNVEPQSEIGRQWGSFIEVYLADAGLGRTSTYNKLGAWQSAKALGIPEAVLVHIAQDDRMLGVGIDKDNPLGKRYTEAAARLAKKCKFGQDGCATEFIEELFKTQKPEAEPSNPSKLHNTILKAVRAQMKRDGHQTHNTELAKKYAYDIMRDLLFAFGYSGTQGIETANGLPTPEYLTYEMLVGPDRESASKAQASRQAKADALRKKKETVKANKALAKATKAAGIAKRKQARQQAKARNASAKTAKKREQESGEQITQVTPHGYFARLNKKPKGAYESTPWEVFHTEAKADVLVRERSKADAAAAAWKLETKAAAEEIPPRFCPTTPEEAAAASA